jgi:predicted nucleotidyltransferase/uncharacterized protein (UPF0332 family)
MVKKKVSKSGKSDNSDKEEDIIITTNIPETLKLTSEREIALDFATKVYSKFDQLVKSIVLFGSSAKQVSTPDSDIDIIILLDDMSVRWDQELIATYREELAKIIQANAYSKSLHINTVKLSTWWEDMMRGDPIIINILRYGDSLIDAGGFFVPLQVLLKEGKIKPTAESIYTLLQRAPIHLARARTSMLAAVDGFYWSMVDSAHAALIAAKVMPPSPEHIPEILDEKFVKTNLLKSKYVDYYYKTHMFAKEIVHGKIKDVTGRQLDDLKVQSDEFVREMARIVEKLIEKV